MSTFPNFNKYMQYMNHAGHMSRWNARLDQYS